MKQNHAIIMTKIVIVVSPYGYGHLTRQIALKNALLNLSPDLSITFVIGEKQRTFFSKEILTTSQVAIEQIPLVPTITGNSLSIDVESTAEIFKRFWEWETQIRDDRAWERILYGAQLIINDIESVHNPIAKKMGIPMINISNFTWSDILYGLGLDQLSQNYISWEKLADYHICLPFSTMCAGFTAPTHVGILSRKIDWDRVTLIHDRCDGPLVLLGLTHSTSTDLSGHVNILLEAGYSICVSSAYYTGPTNSRILLLEEETEKTQDYYAAADLVVAKVGYSTISEVITGGTPMLYWKRPGFIEENVLADAIIQRQQGREIQMSISPEDLLEEIENFLEEWTSIKDPEIPANETIAKQVLSYIN